MAKDNVAAIGDKPTRRKPKQDEIPGTERERVPEIDAIAEQYADTRDQWQALGKNLETLKGKLHEAMKAHDLRVYPLDSEDYELVELVAGEEDVKVRRKPGRPRRKASGDEE